MENLKMKLRLERKTALSGATNDAFLFVEVEAPKAALESKAEDLVLELALVLDVSGSMAGLPLEAAQAAARRFVSGLREKDRLTLVVFDSHVKKLCALQSMTASHRQDVIAAINRLEAGSMTDLHGGWQEAANTLLEGGPGEETARRVVLLSDGHANVGLTDRARLGEQAREMASRGVYTTCVGIGDGYSTEQLQALAEHGGGRLHDAERPHEIVEVVMAELCEVLRTTAESVRLELGFPARAHVTCLSGYPAQFVEGAATFQLGSLVSEGKREAVLRLRFSDRFREQDVRIQGAIRWRRPGEEADLVTEEASACLSFGPETPRPRTKKDSKKIVNALVAHLVRAVTELNRALDWRGLRRLARRELLAALELCEPHKSLHPQADHLVQLFSAARRPIEERSRKEMALANYKSARMENDLRHEQRPEWPQYLGASTKSSISNTIEDVKQWMNEEPNRRGPRHST